MYVNVYLYIYVYYIVFITHVLFTNISYVTCGNSPSIFLTCRLQVAVKDKLLQHQNNILTQHNLLQEVNNWHFNLIQHR